jgi:ERF superfamily
MHRSSENVAAIATALAKAQTELSNPEKAMIGTIYNARTDSPQNFRYASLSSGLDIIRKALGGHQIAITQTTDIDRASGTVNLTTILLHTSGEWISSDWPVCQLSETSAPRRMGAALTYARRYALFTMVGIAGEDDLDAPDLANDGPKGDKPVQADRAPSSGLEPVPARSSQSRTTNPAAAPVRETLSAEESAAARTLLIQEIQTLPEDGLRPRAIAILKAKNRLSLGDAKQVEQAFAARIAPQDPAPDAPATEEPTSTPINLVETQPHLASTAAVKRPRGRHRKANTASNHSAGPPVSSPSTIDAGALGSRLHQADSAPAKIDKSQLTFGEPRRLRDKAHLKFVASQPCLICGRNPADAHHLRFTQPRAMGLKVSDEFTVPLCRIHHRDVHSFGDEVGWWERRAIDPLATSRVLWVSTRRLG